MLKQWARCLGLKAKDATLDEVIDCIATQEKPMLFLVDEADKFIHVENKKDYPLLKAMRALSEEGKAFFILAGYWQLYQHLAMDYQSPLKNFGEMINLGALEPEACRDLATVPMATMNLRYDEAALARLLHACGGRANLISITCAEIVKHIGGRARVITLNMVEEALDSELMGSSLSGWDTLAGDDAESRKLARMVMFAMLDEERFTRTAITTQLNELGVAYAATQLDEVLQRLVLAFVLGREKDVYFRRVPLLKEALLMKGSVQSLLAGEL
jgi:hypothetical protein